MQEFQFRQVEDESYAIMGYQGGEAEVTIPGSYGGKPVTILFDDLFAGHEEITSVLIPDTVTDLGEFLFEGCTSLRHVDLPQSITAIWPYAFARSGIEEITLPDKLSSIAPYTFKECKNLRKVVCGAGMKKINAYAFQGCGNLTELVYGTGVQLSPKAFAEGDGRS